MQIAIRGISSGLATIVENIRTIGAAAKSASYYPRQFHDEVNIACNRFAPAAPARRLSSGFAACPCWTGWRPFCCRSASDFRPQQLLTVARKPPADQTNELSFAPFVPLCVLYGPLF